MQSGSAFLVPKKKKEKKEKRKKDMDTSNRTNTWGVRIFIQPHCTMQFKGELSLKMHEIQTQQQNTMNG
jgi:hypothetical protein